MFRYVIVQGVGVDMSVCWGSQCDGVAVRVGVSLSIGTKYALTDTHSAQTRLT